MSEQDDPSQSDLVLPSDEQVAAISLVAMATSQPSAIPSRETSTTSPISNKYEWSHDMSTQEEVSTAVNHITRPSSNSVSIEIGEPSGGRLSNCLSNGLDLLHFDRASSMNLRTRLTSHDRRTSFEHVNQIIKHGTSALVSSMAKPSVIVEQRTPLSLNETGLRSPSKHVVKKVIVLQPGDDPEQVTSDAINEITQRLNMEAAKRMAQGRIPEKETVIEITRIKAPSEGYVIQDHLQHVQLDSTLPHDSQYDGSTSLSDRKHHRRKSPHPKRYMYHSPSPPHGKVPTSTSSSSADCYFQHSHPHSSSRTTASSKLLGRGAVILQAATQLNNAKLPQRPAILRSHHRPHSDSTITCQPGNANLSIDDRHRLITVPHFSKITRTQSADNSVLLKLPQILQADPEIESETADGNKLDESLTNIQWLGSMSGNVNLSKPNQTEHRDYRLLASNKQIDMISRECGRKKRPPYSYMHLIQMAICSDVHKRKTLKEIYRWIEEKFPYYMYCSNQGWKNSIRHNLSLYDIFVREKLCRNQGKSGSSYWTLRSDVPLKPTKPIHSLMDYPLRASPKRHEIDLSYSTQPAPQPSRPLYIVGENNSPSTPSLVIGHNTIKKKGPVPLLPKPPPVQTYALIPIQGGMPVIPQQPIMVSPVPIGSTSNTPSTCPGPAQKPVLDNTRVKHIHSQNSQLLAIRPGSATELIQRPPSVLDPVKRPGSACELQQISQHAEMVHKLLANEVVRPEGMSTPPPLSELNVETQSKSNLKRNHSPTETPGGSQKKHVKIAAKVDVYDMKTHKIEKQLLRNSKATCTMTNTTITCSNSPSASMDSTELGHQLAQIRFTDSGIISDCSASESTTDGHQGLPMPKMYTSLRDRSDLPSVNSPLDSDKKKETFLSLDCSSVSELGLHDILSSIEKSLSTPMRKLLCTPPKSEENYFTSTPFKLTFGSPSWSPIKGLTPIAGDPSLEANLFTPIKGEAMTSTPCRTDTPDGKGAVNCTPEGKNCPSGHFADLSPLKTPFKSPSLRPSRSERSPTDGMVMDNHSFAKLLGEFHLESMIDEGINLDVSNMSFSALQ